MSIESSASWSHVPSGASVLMPYVCPRECAKAIDWYVDVFGAVEDGDRFVDPDGRIGHAQIVLDGASLMLSDAYPDYGAVAPESGNTTATFALHLYVPDVDSTVAAAEGAGAVVQRAAEDQPHGSRMATLVDPFGVRWMVATHLRNVKPEELARQAREFSGAEPGPVA